MADLDYYGADYGAEKPSKLGEAARSFGWVNWAGAITSLGLTAGMAVWAVDLTFRDMSEVPVIAALEGPMRVAPENPGGKVAPFQGMALSDISSGGGAAPAPDEIVLAPPPVDLNAPALGARQAATAPVSPPPQAVEQTASTPEATPVEGELDIEALAEELAAGLPRLEEVENASAPSIVAPDLIETSPTPILPEVAQAPAAAAAPTGPGIAISVRPTRRPASLRAAAAPTPTTVPTEAPAAEAGTQVAALTNARDVDPASILPGTRVVQLGAYDSEAVARAEWDRLEGRFGAYMDGKGRLIQKARSGGRDFWRLRVVGFADGSDARRFCSALLARDAACIPVTVR